MYDIVVLILTLNFGMGGSARAKLDDEVVELKPWDASACQPRQCASSRRDPRGRVHRLRRAKHREPRRRVGAELVDGLTL